MPIFSMARIARLAVFGFAIVTVTAAIAQDRPQTAGADRARPGGIGAHERSAGSAGATKSHQKAGAAHDQDADSRFGGAGADGPQLERARSADDSTLMLAAPRRHRPEADCRRRHPLGDRFKPTKATAEPPCDSRPQ
jgi:hypothetical protein